MKKCRAAIILTFLALVAGCARTPDVTLNLSVDSDDRMVLEEVRRILLFRFGEFRPSFFSSIESDINGSAISFRFKGGAPEESILTYLYETPGRVNAVLVENSGLLFTDQDIEQAGLAHENGSSVVRLRLAPTAGERVLALTTRNVGRTARLTMDGRALLEATITGALRDSFQITSPEQDPQKAMALVVVLRSGALPAAVSFSEPAHDT